MNIRIDMSKKPKDMDTLSYKIAIAQITAHNLKDTPEEYIQKCIEKQKQDKKQNQ